jgi:hypothetical protein
VRQQYLDELQRTIEGYRAQLTSAGIDYCLLDTSQPLEFALSAYLSTRSRSTAAAHRPAAPGRAPRA